MDYRRQRGLTAKPIPGAVPALPAVNPSLKGGGYKSRVASFRDPGHLMFSWLTIAPRRDYNQVFYVHMINKMSRIILAVWKLPNKK
jgi:hypothetical protein